MRTLRISKAMSYLVPSLITTGLFVSSTALAMPLQTAVSTTPKPVTETVIKTETSGSRKSTVLVRNTTAKPAEPAHTNTKTTPQKVQDKKAVSRCWKRLMDMVREIRHTQSVKNN